MLKMKIGIDVDDTLLALNPVVIEMANKDYKMNPPLTIDEITSWNTTGRASCIIPYYSKKEVYEKEYPIEGSQRFIRELSKFADIYFVTAIHPQFCGLRYEQLQKFYPEVPADHYIFAYQKGMVELDILLDDGGHNILDANAKIPVLLRRPWNRDISGMMSVNSYDEFMNLVKHINHGTFVESGCVGIPTVFALVGPSGSGKTAILNELLNEDDFEKPRSYTTRVRRGDDPDNAYIYVSKEEFDNMDESGQLLENSFYAGNRYGSAFSEVERILKGGHHVVTAVDISGAMAIKMHFPTVICFIRRGRADMIRSIIGRNTSDEDKTKRILSIENELKNQQLVDIVVDNRTTKEKAVSQIIDLLA